MSSPAAERIVVVDLRIPFFRLVFFFVKATLAAVPAAFIVFIIGMVLSATFAAFVGTAPDLLDRWKL